MRTFEQYRKTEGKKTSTTNNETFIEKRKVGAAEIATKATAKGGYSNLTSWHFKAKATPYKEAQKAIKDDKPVSFFEKKYKNAMSRLHGSGLHTQKDFQKIVGELEVWGETLIQVRTNKGQP